MPTETKLRVATKEPEKIAPKKPKEVLKSSECGSCSTFIKFGTMNFCPIPFDDGIIPSFRRVSKTERACSCWSPYED